MCLLTIPFFFGGISALVKCSSSQRFEILHVNLEVWLSLLPLIKPFVIDQDLAKAHCVFPGIW